MTNKNEVHMTGKVMCDICKTDVASFDGKTKMGPWAYMCEECFIKYGVGLGTGRGQKLIYPKPKTKEEVTKELKEIFERTEKELDAVEKVELGNTFQQILVKANDAIFDLLHYIENGDDEEELTPNEYAAKLYSK